MAGVNKVILIGNLGADLMQKHRIPRRARFKRSTISVMEHRLC